MSNVIAIDSEPDELVIKEWIDKHYPDKDASTNQCNKAVRDIVRAFPELNVRVGLANGIFHCWAVDCNGEVVDPTSKQFNEPIDYHVIADRFLERGEYEPSTGAVFI